MIQKIITDGRNRATITINNNKEAIVKFSKGTSPKFVARIGAMVDEFIYQQEEDLGCWMVDAYNFERNSQCGQKE